MPGRSGRGVIVLAIDTATDGPAVALRRPDRTAERPLAWRGSFRQLPAAVRALMDEAGLAWDGLEAIAVPAGPGSFTGLRVGAAFALALAELGPAGLHAVPTLAAVAEACAPAGAGRVCATLDARRGRRYAALLEREADGWRILSGPVDVLPEAIADHASGAPIVGPGSGGASIAASIAALVARAPDRHRLASPDALALAYARSGVG